MGQSPLEGTRILDLTRFAAGPVCTYHLAVLGGEVIRVESPGGDVLWDVAPFIRPDGSAHSGDRGSADIPLSHLKRGRGKRSVTIDLRREAGRDLFRRLVGRSDVLVENFRPGVLEEAGLSYKDLSASKPDLIMCSISGYGQTGRYSGMPAMDPIVQGFSGLTAKTGFQDGEPAKPGAALGDLIPAAFAVIGILSALRQRDRTGDGQHIDVAMLDGMLSVLWDEAIDWYEQRGFPPRFGNRDLRGVPVGAYPTVDGHFNMVAPGVGHWIQLCRIIGRPEWADDDRFDNPSRRTEHRALIDGAIEDWSTNVSLSEAVEVLLEAGIPAGPVNEPWWGRTDEHVRERGILQALVHPDAPDDPTPWLGPDLPIRMSGTNFSVAPAERLGTSTDEVLTQLLALDRAELDALREDGAI